MLTWYLYRHCREFRPELVKELLEKHFKPTPDGIPGNDDTGMDKQYQVR